MSAPLLWLGLDVDASGSIVTLAGQLTDGDLEPIGEPARHGVSDGGAAFQAWLSAHAEAGAALVAGPDVPRARRLLATQLPALAEYLHYRSVDLQTLRELVDAWYGGEPSERAPAGANLGHLTAAIDELRAYRAQIFVG